MKEEKMKERTDGADDKTIKALLAKFYDGNIDSQELKVLYDYFLYTSSIPPEYADDVPVVRPLAMMHHRMASTCSDIIEAKTKHRTLQPKHAWIAIGGGSWAAVLIFIFMNWTSIISKEPSDVVVQRQTNHVAALDHTTKERIESLRQKMADAENIVVYSPSLSRAMPTSKTMTKTKNLNTKHSAKTEADETTIIIVDADDYCNMDSETLEMSLCEVQTRPVENSPSRAFNDHTKWEMYCNSECSSEELNNMIDNVLYA